MNLRGTRRSYSYISFHILKIRTTSPSLPILYLYDFTDREETRPGRKLNVAIASWSFVALLHRFCVNSRRLIAMKMRTKF